jgi:protein SCO1/2
MVRAAINEGKNWNTMMSKYSLLGIGVVFGLAMVLAGWFFFDQSYTYQGVLIDPPATAFDFELTDQYGEPFQLSDQRGNVVLIFFGYTNCPDVCPVTLSEFKRIKEQLGDQAERVRFVYITVDPERDSQERVQAYLNNFDPNFIGLVGERESLEPIWEAYGVYAKRQDVGSAAGYLIDHTARTYLIDAQGNWRLNYPFGIETAKITEDIQHLLKEE